MPQVGIVGASGFTGAELMRLCAGHPDLEVVVATGDTQAGRPVADLYPGLAAGYGDLVFEPYTPDVVDGLDAVFLGLPHGASQAVAADLIDRVGAVIDLSADFRLDEAGLYPQWYGAEHARARPVGLVRLRTARVVPRPHRRRDARSRCPGATPQRPRWPWRRWRGPG